MTDIYRGNPIKEYHSLYKQYTKEESEMKKKTASVSLTKFNQMMPEAFLEVSKDVYDEINRRLYQAKEVPFLPINPEYTQKRNQVECF